MALYFSSPEYLEQALEDARNFEYKNTHTVYDAFFTLLKDIKSDELENLLEAMQKRFKFPISKKACYSLLRNVDCKERKVLNKLGISNERIGEIAYNAAFDCLESGKCLGNKMTEDGRFNTTDWIGHCLNEGKLCGQLARFLGLDSDRAIKMGLLHDYGRKIDQGPRHITAGYEELKKLGYEEALAALSHSFFNGVRCSWNNKPLEGFIVNSDGTSSWDPSVKGDHLKQWLDVYNFTIYDRILNVADLMATSQGIVSPLDRINDIATRRGKFEPISRKYFLASFTNTLVEFSNKMLGRSDAENKPKIMAKSTIPLETIEQYFEQASDMFWKIYQYKIKTKEKALDVKEEQSI